jgi:hypothetical protein
VTAPTCVQVCPSGELEPVNVLPLRTIFTHHGAAVLVSLVSEVVPLLLARTCQVVVLSGAMLMSTFLLPASSESRNITPALARALVFCTDVTRATICPSPVSCLVDVVELVGVAEDVGPAGADGVRPAAERIRAGQRRPADVGALAEGVLLQRRRDRDARVPCTDPMVARTVSVGVPLAGAV